MSYGFIYIAHLRGETIIVGVAFLFLFYFFYFFVNGTNWLQFRLNMLNVSGIIIIMDFIEFL